MEQIASKGTRRCGGGCGTVISGNKDLCNSCKTDQQATLEAKVANPADGCTHLVVVHGTVDQEDLYRADGMLVASRQKDVVRYGTDISTARNHLFLNSVLASRWLRVMASVDLVAAARGKQLHEVVESYGSIGEALQAEKLSRPVFEERSIEAQLVVPATIRMN